MAIVEQAALSEHHQPQSELGSSGAGLTNAQGFNIEDVTLAGRSAKLVPLTMEWRNQLNEAASADRAIFRWHVAPMDSPAAISAWIEKALAERAGQTALPFVIIDSAPRLCLWRPAACPPPRAAALMRRLIAKGPHMIAWTTAGPAVAASFLASLVEVVEAFTVVLAVASVRGWRPATLGAAAGLAILVVIVLIFGAAIRSAPLGVLQFLIGVLLLLFGLRWLRKAILRAAGIIDRRDEARAFDGQVRELREEAQREKSRLDWLAGAAACKSVVVEGVEVVFIVIAVGAGRGLLIPASLGAAAACVIVLAVGIAVRRPLARVPENTLKFGVGVLLSSFGAFWTGEGLGVGWPGADLAILAFVFIFAATGLILARIAPPLPAEGSQ